MKRYISFIVITVMFLSFLTSCSKKENPRQTPAPDTSSSAPVDMPSSGGDVYIAYEGLDDAAKQLYPQILQKLQACETELIFNGLQPETVIDSFQAVVADHPELFWMNGGYSYRYETLGSDITVYFTPVQSSRINSVSADSALVDSVVSSVVSQAAQYPSDYDKVLFVHDYIVNNTTYDQATYNKMLSSGDSNIIYDASTAYGCLVGKNAVCSGYSAAFMLIMQQLGIRCGRVSGSDLNGGSHEWNYILLDGEYYFIDVTWDDPVMQGGEQTLSHEYFLIDENELLMSHIIGADQVYPYCGGKALNYHRKNGRYLERYDFETYKAIVESNIANGAVDIKFSSAAEQQKAYTELFNNERIFEIANFSAGVSYSTSASGLVLTVQYN